MEVPRQTHLVQPRSIRQRAPLLKVVFRKMQRPINDDDVDEVDADADETARDPRHCGQQDPDGMKAKDEGQERTGH